MISLQQARSLFARDRFATETTGVHIVEVGDHFARCSLSIRPDHRNAMGAVMGGVLFTLADFTFAVAANTDALEWVSLQSSINFLSSASSSLLSATARCVRMGRSTAFFEIEIRNESDLLLAVVSTTGMRVPVK